MGKAFPSGLLLRRAALPLLAGGTPQRPRCLPRCGGERVRLRRLRTLVALGSSIFPSVLLRRPPPQKAKPSTTPTRNWLRDFFDRVLHRVRWRRLAGQRQPSNLSEPWRPRLESLSIFVRVGEWRVTPAAVCDSDHPPSLPPLRRCVTTRHSALFGILAAPGGLLRGIGSAPRTGGAGVNGKNGYPLREPSAFSLSDSRPAGASRFASFFLSKKWLCYPPSLFV